MNKLEIFEELCREDNPYIVNFTKNVMHCVLLCKETKDEVDTLNIAPNCLGNMLKILDRDLHRFNDTPYTNEVLRIKVFEFIATLYTRFCDGNEMTYETIYNAFVDDLSIDERLSIIRCACGIR
jgi:hypothetical protein